MCETLLNSDVTESITALLSKLLMKKRNHRQLFSVDQDKLVSAFCYKL